MSKLMDELLDKEYRAKFHSWAVDMFLNTSWVDQPNVDWYTKKTNAALDAVRKEKPILIGLCGNMGVGKDSATEFCIKHNVRCTSIAFADPIRQIGKIFGFTMKQMTDRRLKEELDDYWKFSPRYFMQKVGTEMFRNQLREDVWIDLFKRRMIDLQKPFMVEQGFPTSLYGTYRVIFVTDVRFQNEADAIRGMGGYIFKIIREGFSKKGDNLHPSERFINQIKADLEIQNDAKSEFEWTWKFTKCMATFFKRDAYYYN